jgi:hypothetical protein
MSQSGQRGENLGMEKIMLKLLMMLMKLIAMLTDHQEGRLRKRGGSIQILIRSFHRRAKKWEDRQHREKERDDRLFHLEKQKMALEQEQHEKKIMETDTTNMDKESQLYFKFMKEERQ